MTKETDWWACRCYQQPQSILVQHHQTEDGKHTTADKHDKQANNRNSGKLQTPARQLTTELCAHTSGSCASGKKYTQTRVEKRSLSIPFLNDLAMEVFTEPTKTVNINLALRNNVLSDMSYKFQSVKIPLRDSIWPNFCMILVMLHCLYISLYIRTATTHYYLQAHKLYPPGLVI